MIEAQIYAKCTLICPYIEGPFGAVFVVHETGGYEDLVCSNHAATMQQ